MRAVERRSEIERFLSTDREVSVEELARMLGVTASTIRRDLTHLTNEGRVTRTYGGAMIASGGRHEQTLWERSREAREEKDAIARWAAAQVQPGETVILDAGTTVGRMVHFLREHTSLRVITNGLTTVTELAKASHIGLIVLGGELRHISQGFVGPLSEHTLQRLTADRAFLGADGLVARRGICEASTVQTSLKELMMARAERTYVLADSRKIGLSPFTAWAPLVRPWTLVTDDGVTTQQLDPFKALSDVEIVTVDPKVPLAGTGEPRRSRATVPDPGTRQERS